MGGLRCGLPYYVLTAFYFVDIIESVPPDYCLYPLNMSDCHGKPTPVFSYYKPGSRCEIEIWRGCPTYNKFDNEYECSHNCIFKFYYKTEEENLIREEETVSSKEENLSTKEERFRSLEEKWFGSSEEGKISVEVNPEPLDECEAELNKQKCSKNATRVITHINGTCVEATWYGCPTRNKFQDKVTCLELCLNETITEWKEELEDLELKDIEEIDEILEDIMEDNERIKQLYSQNNNVSKSSSEEEEDDYETIQTGHAEQVDVARTKFNRSGGDYAEEEFE